MLKVRRANIEKFLKNVRKLFEAAFIRYYLGGGGVFRGIKKSSIEVLRFLRMFEY